MIRTELRLAASIVLVGIFVMNLSAAAPAEPQPAQKTAVRSDYVLQPSDVIKVQVFQEDDLTREVRLSQESSVSLPMIGNIDLKGKTLAEAQNLIRTLYDRSYLVNPQVTIIILEYSKRSVTVLGSVNKPGVVLFPQETGLNLLDAIARADGFSRLADKKRVRLTRINPEGKAENFTINADEIMKDASNDAWVLLKDDVISVPERVL
jgi:polysaccharide export outer membrane protein